MARSARANRPPRAPKPVAKGSPQLQRYYNAFDIRLLYALLLGGRRHFGYYASRDSWPVPLLKALRRMEDQLFEALDLKPGSRVLDAGCGSGKVAIHLAKLGLQVDGVDAMPKHVRRAQRRIERKQLGGKLSAQVGDYHDLAQFGDGTYDGLYTMETLVHSTDPERALREFMRVLKPGGHIAHFEYDHVAASDMPEAQSDSLALINKHAAMPALDTFEKGVLEQMLRDVGFVDVKLRDISEHVEPMFRLFYFLAYYPYLFIVYLGIQSWFANIVHAVEMYEQAEAGIYRYVVVTARKPGESAEKGAVQKP